MEKKGFEFSGLSRPPFEVEYKPVPDADASLRLEINPDAMTLERMEALDDYFVSITPRQGERDVDDAGAALSMYAVEKTMLKVRAAMLGGLPGEKDIAKRFVRSWNVVKGNKPLAPVFETFVDMSAPSVAALHKFVMDSINKMSDDEVNDS